MKELIEFKLEDQIEGIALLKQKLTLPTFNRNGRVSHKLPEIQSPFSHPFQNKHKWNGGLNLFQEEWKCSLPSANILNNLIFIPNSYDLLTPKLISPSLSYPSIKIRDNEKKTWGAAHNYYNIKDKYYNLIDKKSLIYEEVKSQYIYIVIQWHSCHSNYFHWLTEILPKFYLLGFITNWRLPKNIRFVTVGYRLKKFQYESLCLLFSLSKIDIIHYSRSVKFEKSLVIHPPSPGWLATSFLKEMSNHLISNISESKLNNPPYKSNKPLFIKRGETRNFRDFDIDSKKYINELIYSGSIDQFDPGLYTFTEQIAQFYNSNSIFGIHGAAFANLIFSQSKNRTIEFSSLNYPDIPTYYLSGISNIKWSNILLSLDQYGFYKLNGNCINTIMEYFKN